MKLRSMTAEELPAVLDWAADEGWNPGLDDAVSFHAADPEGFFVAEAEGRIVAAISVVNHTDDVAFLGLYLCRPDWRGRGIGYALWTHALDHAGARTVGLDGVEAQQDNYRKSGFALAGRTVRYAGVLPGRAHPGIGPVLKDDIGTLIAMEAEATGYEKRAFLAAWTRDCETRRTLVCRAAGEIAGFATIRACREGWKIGPLVAGDGAVAAALIETCGSVAHGAPAMIDVPGTSPWLAGHCTGLGLSPVFGTARMYRGPAPQPGPLISAVATLELG
ncbi:N-acetyltransferase [Rhodovulum sp. BSW8]|uniref:GNAT family N-acetyltransferase n=1 Tax=Rhodovulum sp. BSW8 TaxID=2259645 RepID=UPI000DE2188A|nr:GNAT family N-acetyltransferase [Rhodovulum sp. BSW8]RBO52859.1 N-acetyltransferase [Rhodovulum sp. BSW8]